MEIFNSILSKYFMLHVSLRVRLFSARLVVIVVLVVVVVVGVGALNGSATLTNRSIFDG